jgi:hypothetical protein
VSAGGGGGGVGDQASAPAPVWRFSSGGRERQAGEGRKKEYGGCFVIPTNFGEDGVSVHACHDVLGLLRVCSGWRLGTCRPRRRLERT